MKSMKMYLSFYTQLRLMGSDPLKQDSKYCNYKRWYGKECIVQIPPRLILVQL